MKKKFSKIFIMILSIGLIALTISCSQVQAALQSNPNTQYTRRNRAVDWMLYFRNMEIVGGALGLSETINGTTKLATSESNNLDSHMIRSTEYGAIAILSASGYGNPKTMQTSTIKTTTGNETGIYITTTTSSTSSYDEYVAGGLSGKIFSGVNGRYYDAYIATNETAAKKGDALGTATAANPGCDEWHSSSCYWANGPSPYFVRNYNSKIFGFDDANYDDAHYSRGVIVCGEGF